MRKSLRTALVLAVAPISAVLVTGLASPALAMATPEPGSDPGPGLTVAQTVLLYVVTPAVIIGAIWVIVLAVSWARTPRYRPGQSWWAEPVWVNGPARHAELAAPDRSAALLVPATDEEGGARARW